MKIMFAFSLLLSSILFMDAQSDSWKIYHNKQELLNTTEENQSKNTLAISKSEFDKIGDLVVEYHEGNPNNEWKRTIGIVDENSNSLFEKAEINKIQVSNFDLKKLIGDHTKISIYTWAIPKDPAKAALVRIRRVHLCTILLK